MKIKINGNDQQLIVDALTAFAETLKTDCENIAKEAPGNASYERIRLALAKRREHAETLADAIADVEEE